MRKYLTKEVTFTVCQIAKIELINGTPQVVTLPELQLLGSVSEEKCIKLVQKEHGSNASIYEHYTYSQVYEMEVTEFIKHAKIKGAESDNYENVEDQYNDDYVKEF
jgi:hypothetical protein